MEAKELIKQLRIGNYIYDDDNVVVKVESIESERSMEYDDHQIGIAFSKSDNNVSLFESEVIKPIELTEEWMLKCPEFEKANDMDYWYKMRIRNDWTFLFVNPKHKMAEISISGHGCVLKFDGFLHTLQNLIHSLTGEDLTIKE